MPLLSETLRRPVRAGWLTPALIAALMPSLAQPAGAQSAPQPLRFVVTPKVSHPWYDAVRQGAETAGRMIQQPSGRPVVIDDQPPTAATADHEVLISEDFSHGQQIGGLRVLNPLREG